MAIATTTTVRLSRVERPERSLLASPGRPERHRRDSQAASWPGAATPAAGWEDARGGALLQLTSRAAAFVAFARFETGLPPHYGLRISRRYGLDSQRPALDLDFVEDPHEGDQVGESEGTRVFVAPDIAEPFADALLDVEETAEGHQLVLRRRS